MHNGATQQEMVAALTSPFSPDEVKTRPGNGGREFRYVSPPAVIKRLNEAAGEWNFEVRKEWTDNGVTKALVRLEIPGLGYREHIGIQEQGGNQGADALAKGAVSDALKKAASLFGIALDLYEDAPMQVPTHMSGYQQNVAPQQQPQQFNQQPQQQQFNQQQQNGPRPYNPQYDDGQMPSQPQGGKLRYELNRTGIPVEQAAQMANVTNFRGVDSLTKRQMSAIIDWLTFQQVPQGGNQQGGGMPYGGAYAGSDYDDPVPDYDTDMNSVPF